jgi:D-alanyl-D-alanine carboxypeptidase/D-alanyl-D-alanine-endopeptidase (penicillin-binding protein 4)
MIELLKAMPKRTSRLQCIAKPIGLLILLFNVQLNIGQEKAEASTFSSQSGKDTSLGHPYIVLASSPVSKPKSKVNTVCPAGLTAEIEGITERSQFQRSRWGILIQTLSSAQTLYSRDAHHYFVPASNVKILTTAAALYQLGPDFRMHTSVDRSNDGSLRIKGQGDPSLTDAQLRALAQQLNRQGIRQFSQLIAEDDYFRGTAVNPSWEWEDVQVDYGAPVNSLILNQNVLALKLLPQQLGQPLRVIWADPTEATRWQIENKSVTAQTGEPASINVSRDLKGSVLKITGQLSLDSEPESVTLAEIDPGEKFLRHFRHALAVEGINETADPNRYSRILKLLSRLGVATKVDEVATVESPPLSQLLIETNQNSNNLYAEALLRTLGAKADSLDNSTSTADLGLGVVKATLTQLGVDPTSYVLADASGLSRHNLVSPEAIAQTLRAMAKSPQATIYRASLPIAGISGTLKNRFRDSAAQGIVQAKTGTMSGIVALSGYLDAPNYEPLVFSMIVNQSEQPAATIRQAIDEIVLLLVKLRHC